MAYLTKNLDQTISLGKKFGKDLGGGEVFLLTGDLGGGKTQFTKGIALELGVKEHVTSPTFIYENIYQGKKLTLYHFDLYRSEVLDDDIKYLILEAYSDPLGVTVIEWAERAKKIWPKSYRHLHFLWLTENKRKIKDLSIPKGALSE